MHKEYILLNGFRKAKRVFTAGFHVPLNRIVYILFSHRAGKGMCPQVGENCVKDTTEEKVT